MEDIEFILNANLRSFPESAMTADDVYNEFHLSKIMQYCFCFKFKNLILILLNLNPKIINLK